MSAIHMTPPRLATHARAVLSGLSRVGGHPRLPRWLLRDAVGTSRYGALTRAPEHYQERTWELLLARHADAIADAAAAPHLVELDAQVGERVALADALVARHGWLHYIACAASEAALDGALERLRGHSPQIELERRKTDNDLGSALADLPTPHTTLACGARFADLGTAEASALLDALRLMSSPLDTLVLAFDLAPDHERACAAYHDAEGNGAKLGLHALQRVNDELGADFELARWTPEVRWNEALGRVELVVVARERQRVFFDALGLPLQFEAGDAIEAATFQKHDEASIDRLLTATRFRRVATYVDEESCCALVVASPA